MKWRGRKQSKNVEVSPYDPAIEELVLRFNPAGGFVEKNKVTDKILKTIRKDIQRTKEKNLPLPKEGPIPPSKPKNKYSTQVTPGDWNEE